MHEHGADALCGPEANASLGARVRAGRAYKVRELDCAEEVAVLKQAVGPLVGGQNRLVFDVVNGRMTVADSEGDVPDAGEQEQSLTEN